MEDREQMSSEKKMENMESKHQMLLDLNSADDDTLRELLEGTNPLSDDTALFTAADLVRRKIYGRDVFIRGLIEFTNYCQNNCLYCGIRHSNAHASRYRLSGELILNCCRNGYPAGFRTFVLQGGEDPWFTDERICGIVSSIKDEFPDCAVTLSVGERSRSSYQAFFRAGADRFLLRHETANDDHYRLLHPADMSPENRRRCLYDLKEIGFQVGAGIMVGSPMQTTDHLIEDLHFLQELQPDMIGIGPFIHHADTPFRDKKNGSLQLTLRLLAILRLMFPHVLLPATTALSSIHPSGRKLGLKAGANVVMPNLGPEEFRDNYSLYDNKLSTGAESASGLAALKAEIEQAGYRIVADRGDPR